MAGLVALRLEHEAASFISGKNPIGVATKGAMSGVTPTLAVRSRLTFLEYYQLPTAGEPLAPLLALEMKYGVL